MDKYKMLAVVKEVRSTYPFTLLDEVVIKHTYTTVVKNSRYTGTRSVRGGGATKPIMILTY